MTELVVREDRLRVEVDPQGVAVEGGPSGPLVIVGVGQQGPAGPPGASGAGYGHTQVDPMSTWTIAHNLGFQPTVQVTDLSGSVVDGEIVHLSLNEVRLFFAIPLAGRARLV